MKRSAERDYEKKPHTGKQKQSPTSDKSAEVRCPVYFNDLENTIKNL